VNLLNILLTQLLEKKRPNFLTVRRIFILFYFILFFLLKIIIKYSICFGFILLARFEKDRELTESEIIDRAYSRKAKRYVLSKLFDNSTHTNLIKKIEYSPYASCILCLE